MRIAGSMIVLLLAACGEASTPPPSRPAPQPEPDHEPTSESPAPSRQCDAVAEGASTQEHLEAVAACFHAAVVAMNREPRDGETLEAFMSSARLPGTPSLALSDGSAVTFEVTDQWHDDLEGGGATFGTTYRFSAPGHPESAATSVQLIIDGVE